MAKPRLDVLEGVEAPAAPLISDDERFEEVQDPIKAAFEEFCNWESRVGEEFDQKVTECITIGQLCQYLLGLAQHINSQLPYVCSRFLGLEGGEDLNAEVIERVVGNRLIGVVNREDLGHLGLRKASDSEAEISQAEFNKRFVKESGSRNARIREAIIDKYLSEMDAVFEELFGVSIDDVIVRDYIGDVWFKDRRFNKMSSQKRNEVVEQSDFRRKIEPYFRQIIERHIFEKPEVGTSNEADFDICLLRNIITRSSFLKSQNAHTVHDNLGEVLDRFIPPSEVSDFKRSLGADEDSKLKLSVVEGLQGRTAGISNAVVLCDDAQVSYAFTKFLADNPGAVGFIKTGGELEF